MSNVYNDLLEIMGGATKVEPSFFIAKLKSPLPSIKVELEGLELDKDDFLVSSSVVVNHTTGQNVMNKGDKVLLVVVNGTYILIDKVVNV